MSEMVERVAVVIGCAAGDPVMWPIGEAPSEEVKDKLRCMARAAIEAMREPSEGMFQAAAPFPEHLRHEHPDPDDRWHRLMEAATIADQMAARSTYQTMIAAALDENAR